MKYTENQLFKYQNKNKIWFVIEEKMELNWELLLFFLRLRFEVPKFATQKIPHAIPFR